MASRLHQSARALALAACLTGCRAERHLVFVTEPPGAEVLIDGDYVGRTPLDLSFESYGPRQVAIRRRGYRGHAEVLEVEEPCI